MNKTDFEIISQVLAGEHKQYAELIDRYKDFAFTIACRITNSQEDAEEIAQDAFIKAFNALATFKGDSKFSTWLYRIVSNQALSYTRKRG